jgi:hypothetical protein
MKLCEGERVWLIEVKIASNCNVEAIWQEECSLNPTPAQLPAFAMPNLRSCLADYACFDIDGMRTDVTYTIGRGSLEKLRSFLESTREERKLPIVLVSPQSGIFPYALDYHAITRLVCGTAHVMRLDAEHEWSTRNAALVHTCYGGAVRLYLPGYRRTDGWKVHPFWIPTAHKISAEDQLLLINEVATYTAAMVPEHPLFRQIERCQNDELSELRLHEAVHAIKSQIQAQTEVEWEKFFDTLETEYSRVRAELTSVTADNRRLSDEVRRLQYLVNNQWSITELPTSDDTATSYPTMAGRAADTYLGLDNSETEEIDNLLVRLLRVELRENQSEVDHFVDGGPCYIYPRSRTAAGKRVLYILNGSEVRICEIYTSHDTYEKARTIGWVSTDYNDATPWSLPGPKIAQIPLPL